MNVGDRPTGILVANLHNVLKDGIIGTDLGDFLHARPDRDRISDGTVANIHLMQERPLPRAAASQPGCSGLGGGQPAPAAPRHPALSPGGGWPRS